MLSRTRPTPASSMAGRPSVAATVVVWPHGIQESWIKLESVTPHWSWSQWRWVKIQVFVQVYAHGVTCVSMCEYGFFILPMCGNRLFIYLFIYLYQPLTIHRQGYPILVRSEMCFYCHPPMQQTKDLLLCLGRNLCWGQSEERDTKQTNQGPFKLRS